MKKLLFSILILSIAFSLSAQPGKHGMTPEELLAVSPGIGDKTPDQLTIAERLAISGAISVEHQKNAYVHRAAVASFLIPGAGQFMTGNTWSGVARLSGEVLIHGGVMTGLYFLLPADLKQWDLTHKERAELFRSYMNPDKIGDILPAMGVAAGGAVLSLLNSVLASHDAAVQARTNIDSGKVTFEPLVMGMMPGLGFRVRM